MYKTHKIMRNDKWDTMENLMLTIENFFFCQFFFCKKKKKNSHCSQDDKWDTIPPLQRERCRFSLTVVEGRLWAVGGEGEEGPASTTEVFDPKTDVWMPQVNLFYTPKKIFLYSIFFFTIFFFTEKYFLNLADQN